MIRLTNEENPYEPDEVIGDYAVKAFEAGATAQLKKMVEHIEKCIFYVDARGYIALKPNATKNWQALLEEIR